MKVFIILKLILLSILLISKHSFARFELRIENYSYSDIIYVRVFPIGAIFNGSFEYSLKCIYSTSDYDKIFGGDSILQKRVGIPSDFELNHDADGTTGGTEASIGYGKYRVEFYFVREENENLVIDEFPFDYCDVDYGDSDYPNNYVNPPGAEYTRDIVFKYYSQDSIIYNFTSNLIPENCLIQIWDQRARNPILYKSQNRNGFISDSIYNFLPINAVDSGATAHFNPGVLNLNFQIVHDVYSNKPYDFIIKKKSILTIEPNKSITMLTPANGLTNLTIEDSSILHIKHDAKIDVYSPNTITLKNKGYLLLNPNSEMIIRNGASFCNEGGFISGNARIIYIGGTHVILCELGDYLLQDSIKFILDSNAVLPIPNNTTLHLRGNTTSLIMKPGSKLLFGENSGIVCDSGGKLIANNATFASVDSTKKWSGISLSGISQDTIKSCTIKNAFRRGGRNFYFKQV